MLKYVLYWGVYPQWTKSFLNSELAVEEARRYARSMDANFAEFKLVQLVEISL